MRQRRIGMTRLGFAFAPLVLTLACGTDTEPASKVEVRINELSSSNHDYQDANGDTDDWIELINLRSEPVDLAGYFIADTANNRFKVELTAGVVVPGNGLLLLWADGEPNQGPAHVAFQLGSTGDGVCLSNPNGYVIDCVEFSAIPPNDAGTEDTSLARFPDGTGNFQWCTRSSPEERNGTRCSGISL